MAFNSMKWLPRPLGNSNEDRVLFSKKYARWESSAQNTLRQGFTPWNALHSSRKLRPETKGKFIACQIERNYMHLLFSPVFASALYIGGGSVGILLVIIVVVLLLR